MNTQGREGGGAVTHSIEEVNGEANGCVDPSLAACYSLTGDKQWDSPSSQSESYKMHPFEMCGDRNDSPELCDSGITRYKPATKTNTNCSLN